MTTCTTCGQIINEVVTIDGLPYGTTCAENKLGIRQFPSWFKTGDWNKAKADHDARQAKQAIEFQESRKITSEAWSEFMLLSTAYVEQYLKGNTWAFEFISSVMKQCGYYTIASGYYFDTMEEAEANWQPSSGSFPYFIKLPKRISDLSPKQQALLNKFI